MTDRPEKKTFHTGERPPLRKDVSAKVDTQKRGLKKYGSKMAE